MPLRERLAQAKAGLAAGRDKAKRIVGVNRLLLAPLPKPVPAVDRLALINYATWLYHERRLACLELYPEAGISAASFIHADVAADHFHFPSGSGSDWRKVPQPSTRALATLDRLGIDWRADRGVSTWSDDKLTSAGAASLPHGGPRLDAALLEALDDLTRLDAAQRAMYETGDASRDGDEVLGYADLEAARDDALDRLAAKRAGGLTGMRVHGNNLVCFRGSSRDLEMED